MFGGLGVPGLLGDLGVCARLGIEVHLGDELGTDFVDGLLAFFRLCEVMLGMGCPIL